VNKAGLLCNMNQFMMEEFSRRTITGLQQHTLFKLMLPAFNSFLEMNVRKEVEKDRQVILRAAALYQSGTTPTDEDVRGLLQQAKAIDQDFLRQISVFPITVNIDYAGIEKVRQQRVQRLLNESHRILTQWASTAQLTAAIAALYDRDEFNVILYDILNLYSHETRLLSHSVRIPSLLFVARDALTQKVSATMQTVAKSLAKEMSGRLYRRAAQAGH